MDRETEYHTELTKINHTNYVRNSRAIVVMWAIFTVIFTVLNVIVFIQPQWIGDDEDTATRGYFGVYRYCTEYSDPDRPEDYFCKGNFLEWNSILNKYFKAVSVMVGISCLLFILCLCSFVLFFLLNTSTVLQFCAWSQLLAGILMTLSCIIYPAGWDSVEIQDVCGRKAGQYDIGLCELRWGYILAIVLVFDAFILAILAFVLAAKQAKLLPGVYKEKQHELSFIHNDYNNSISRGHFNDSFYLSLSDFSVSSSNLNREKAASNSNFSLRLRDKNDI